MLIKKYGARFNKGLKIINLRDILLLSFYLVAVVYAAFQTLDSEYLGLWNTTATLFDVYSDISTVDLQFRGGLQLYIERILLSNTLLYSEVWADRLTPAQQAYRLNLSIYTYDRILTVYLLLIYSCFARIVSRHKNSTFLKPSMSISSTNGFLTYRQTYERSFSRPDSRSGNSMG